MRIRNAQEICQPVKHLSVWDRLATFPDGRSEYQVLVKWFQALPSWNSRAEQCEVLGTGKTEQEAAEAALRAFRAKLTEQIKVLEDLCISINRSLD